MCLANNDKSLKVNLTPCYCGVYIHMEFKPTQIINVLPPENGCDGDSITTTQNRPRLIDIEQDGSCIAGR